MKVEQTFCEEKMEVKGERAEDGKGMAGIDLENWNILARNMRKVKTENKTKCPFPLDLFAVSERREEIKQVSLLG